MKLRRFSAKIIDSELFDYQRPSSPDDSSIKAGAFCFFAWCLHTFYPLTVVRNLFLWVDFLVLLFTCSATWHLRIQLMKDYDTSK